MSYTIFQIFFSARLTTIYWIAILAFDLAELKEQINYKLKYLRLFLPWRASGMSVDECSGSFFMS
jgi:hypothetical protein